ncbi:hypothetical protein ES708_02331 [subsurface metagenome]
MFSCTLFKTISLSITIFCFSLFLFVLGFSSFSDSALTISSIMLKSFLASPPEYLKMASFSLILISNSLRYVSVVIAFSIRFSRSGFSSGLRTYTWQRERRGEITSKEGFSVVAPINVSTPCSTAPSNESCWDLLNR